MSGYLVTVLFCILGDHWVSFKGSSDSIEGDGNVVFLEDLHNTPDGSARAIVKLRLRRRIT